MKTQEKNGSKNTNKKTTKGGKRSQSRRSKKVELNIDDSSINKADLKGAENDYTWYTKYAQLFENVTGINFGNQVGSQLRWIPSQITPSANVFPPTAAGVCAIHYIPTLGAADQTLSSPLNKVASQMFAVMRQQLGSTASYDTPDIMLYLGAMDSAFQLYTMGAKIYGLLQMASPFNNYFLKRMCQANCIDFDSFDSNMSNFRAKLNQYAIFLSSREVPAEFDIYKRHTWLVQNMFTDSSTAKAQIYTFVPDGYYIYTEATSGPAYLKYTPFNYAQAGSTSLLTFSDWSTAINNIYESLLMSSDINQMSADIGKAFQHEVFTMQMIPENYVTPIAYSSEVLSQIENCILLGSGLNTANGSTGYNYWDIYQTVDLPRDPRLVQSAKCSTYTGGTLTQVTRDNLQIYTSMKI